MSNYFIVPGLRNSGPEHWQTFFEKSGSNFKRIKQQEWDAPNCNNWIEAIDKAIEEYDPSTVILIAHSLGCSTVAHRAATFNKKIKGALLVAPSDLEAPAYTFSAEGFSPIPEGKINFPTIVVASENDPWVTVERARFFADNWGSEFVNIGNAGHINTAAGYGQWAAGLQILQQL
jgi:uncharacterized protein